MNILDDGQVIYKGSVKGLQKATQVYQEYCMDDLLDDIEENKQYTVIDIEKSLLHVYNVNKAEKAVEINYHGSMAISLPAMDLEGNLVVQ